MKLDYVQLAMPPGQEDAARAFFVNVLGMEETEKPHPLNQRGGVWFRSGDAILHLGVESDFKPQKKAHPAFLLPDIVGMAAKLEAAGHSVVWDTALPDRRRFYTEDPFGNRIECIADGHGFSQR